MSKKQIVITRFFDSGGSNSHFKTLIKYFGAENMVVVLEKDEEQQYISSITATALNVKIISSLHAYAYLAYKFTTNVKEAFLMIRSLWICFWLSVRHGFAGITISAVEPERHLYLFWLPFIKVNYILHSQPSEKAFSFFSSLTCNARLGKRKQIITVSNAMKQNICNSWSIKPSHQLYVNVIPNCIILLENTSENGAQLPSSGKTVLTVGHVNERKNPELWLKVAKAITGMRSDVNFLWLGNGNLLSQYEALTQHTDRIRFMGHISDPRPYLDQTCIYYQPSLIEPHGIAVIEAMSHGLPCVVSNTGGLPESVINNYNGIVAEPSNQQQHINAINLLLTDSSLQIKFGVNSKKRFAEHFTYHSFQQKMDNIYKG